MQLKNNTLIIQEVELPLKVTIKGKNGERADYVCRPAGKKFGASLNKIEECPTKK